MKNINTWNLAGAIILILAISTNLKAKELEIDWEAQAKAEWIAEFGDTPRNMTEEEFKYAKKFTLAKQQLALSTTEKNNKKSK
ncbi:hypothetical protein [Pasteurella sp. PK-2025]|uniref:hypothetical protein n=1 Tax=unclassified Pasteurella TaxID=2621516 RepID=UPI003C792B43